MAVPVLNIPSQELNKRPRPYLKAKHIQRWLDELPTTNTSRVTQQVIEQLKIINRSRYPAHDRIRLLDTLRPATRQLLAQLKQPLHNARLPLDRNQKHSAELIQTMLEEMAAGYKSVVSQLILRNSHKDSDEMLLREAIYHSIQYLARRLVEAYLIYMPEPYDVWRELHQLYDYALQSGMHNLPVDDPYPEYMLPVAYSIDLVYKRILLLSLAAPYHLMQNEAEELYHLLSSWCNECHIYPVHKQQVENEFVFDLASDLPPRYLSSEMDWQPTNGRSLDIRAVCLRLDNFIEQFLHHESIEEIHSLVEIQQRDMLLRLAQALEGSLSRQNPRRSTDSRVRIAVGLNPAHFYLSGQTPFTPEMDDLKIRGQFNIKREQFAATYKTALEKDRRHTHSHYTTYTWKQNNASTTGSSLTCALESDEQAIRVGELVAYTHPQHSNPHWHVGLVRWLKFHSDSGVDMGIMNLSHSAIPVAVRAMRGTGQGTDYFRALIIPKQVSMNQTRSLVVPATIYDVKTVLTINMKNRFLTIRLTRQLLSTRAFTQFEFDVVTD